MEEAIGRAIQTMWNRYNEPLSLAELADTAILSKFYFARVFKELTGVSPGRFLMTIRLAQAKQLLLETSFSVTDVSCMVGYNSLGTFTSRFTQNVGVPPARYRAMSSEGNPSLERHSGPAGVRAGVVGGWIQVLETRTPVRVYVGVFKDRITRGIPISCDIRDGSGPYLLERVPEGEWFLRVVVVAARCLDPRPWNRRPLSVGSVEAVTVRADRISKVSVQTRLVRLLDLPVLTALPELDCFTVPEPRTQTLARARFDSRAA